VGCPRPSAVRAPSCQSPGRAGHCHGLVGTSGTNEHAADRAAGSRLAALKGLRESVAKLDRPAASVADRALGPGSDVPQTPYRLQRLGFDDLPGWTFSVEERSAGVYVVRGADEAARAVELVGEDQEDLMRRCHADVVNRRAYSFQLRYRLIPWGVVNDLGRRLPLGSKIGEEPFAESGRLRKACRMDDRGRGAAELLAALVAAGRSFRDFGYQLFPVRAQLPGAEASRGWPGGRINASDQV